MVKKILPSCFLLLVISSCQSEAHPNAVNELRDWEPDRVVAVVDGFPVGAAEFEHYWALHPTLEREEVFDALIARQAAISNHLAELDSAGPAVQHGRKQALARLAVGDILERLAAEEGQEVKIENEDWVAAYARFGHPRGYRVSHVVMMPNDLEKVDEMSDELDGHARQIRQQLPDDANSFDLIDVVQNYPVPSDMTIALDLHLTTMAPDMQQYEQPNGWKPLDPDFVAGVESMAADDQRVSQEPIKSRYGTHVVILEEVVEEREPSESELEGFARTNRLRTMASSKINDEILEKMRNSNWWVSKERLDPETEAKNQ